MTVVLITMSVLTLIKTPVTTILTPVIITALIVLILSEAPFPNHQEDPKSRSYSAR